jgi:hypothetical protein
MFTHNPRMTEEKRLFIERLTEVVRMLGYPDRGRQTQLAANYKLTQGAVRKWFAGDSQPAYGISVDLCKRARVSYDWLKTGRGPKELSYSTEPTVANTVNEVLSPYLEQRFELTWVSDEELEVLTLMRQATEQSKSTLIDLARRMELNPAKMRVVR